ncbi:MAG: adenine deaminase [Bacteroidales bacterium]
MSTFQEYTGMIVDVVSEQIFPGKIRVSGGKIDKITTLESGQVQQQYILPGLVDAHVHIESSMLTPVEFARVAVRHGTIATVSDPHEIGNVLGKEGIDYMIQNGNRVPFKFYFGAPSCVPATPFETSGAEINANDIEELMSRDEIKYLAEMMNFPGVLNQDKLVMDKLRAAQKYGKPIDGHAPGLQNEAAQQYAQAGISTDHECFTKQEAVDKLNAGMKVQIREGSAARNFDALISVLKDYPEDIMFCSDDKHPDELIEGHINRLVVKSMAKGYDLITALKPCTINPKNHYKLDNGLLQENDPADFIIIDHPERFNILQTFINGKQVAENKNSLIEAQPTERPNKFVASTVKKEDLETEAQGGKLRVIEVHDGQLVTNELLVDPKIEHGKVVSDTERDILKIVVLNRYKVSKPAIGFIHNIGLKAGAMISTVAHDSHNIIVVGVTDEEILKAIEKISDSKGGIGYIKNNQAHILPLPIGGIISDQDGFTVAEKYKKIDNLVKQNGSLLSAPYMTLSFMGLLVIPSLKLSDQGLFDGNQFKFIDLFKIS